MVLNEVENVTSLPHDFHDGESRPFVLQGKRSQRSFRGKFHFLRKPDHVKKRNMLGTALD